MTVSISPFMLRAWTSSIQIHFIYIRNFRLHLYCVLSCVRFACRIINRVRLVDSHWSSSVTVVGFESLLVTVSRVFLQSDLPYLLEDHRARLYQYWCEKGFPIFRQVPINIDLVESRHTSIWLPNNMIRNPAITTPCLLRLLTSDARLASPRSLILACESKNTSKNKEDSSQICRWQINLMSWGLTNRQDGKIVLDIII